MGCVVSKEEEDDVVSLCKERTRLLKLAVDRRYAFADAQSKYNQSLYAIAAAIRLFVARHSSASSPFLITFPSSSSEPTENLVSNPQFLQQRPSKPIHEAIACQSSYSTACLEREKRKQQETHVRKEQGDFVESQEDEGEEEEEEEEEVACEHFYSEMAPLIPSPNREFRWDFFNLFNHEIRTEIISGFGQGSEENVRVAREADGIPGLEEDGEQPMAESKVETVKNGNVGHEKSEVSDARREDEANASQRENMGFKMVDSPKDGRELLEALKDVEDHFTRAYESGLDVSRMLETSRVQSQSGFEEIKETSSKLIRSLTWSRTASSRSSSCKSLLTSSSHSSSSWTDFRNDLFDDYGGMESGSHSLTLGRLYAWEKKLYEEVKTGEETRKTYLRKCSLLKKKDAKGDGLWPGGKTRAEARDLHTRISVVLRRVESISERIQKLRDEELQPQLVELLHGLMRNWKIMLETHETQNRIMFEVTSFSSPAIGKFCNDSHRLATLQIEAELHNWRDSFMAYVSTQKAYVEALAGWLSKFIAPEFQFYSMGRSSLPESRVHGLPLLVTCHDWLAFVEKLPDKAVKGAMKSFGKDIHALWTQQGEEQQQKRKVDGLAKELERKVLAFQRAENKILQSKISDEGPDENAWNRIQYLADRKSQLDLFRKRIDAEKAKHQTSMQETQQIMVKGFQVGLSSVFLYLAEFSKASAQMYAKLVTYSENSRTTDSNNGNPSYMEDICSHY